METIKIIKELENEEMLVEINGEKIVVNKSYLEMLKNGTLENLGVLTHNCGQRLVCGRLGSIASRMALDDQQACTIDGKRKGAGIIKSQGEVAHIQYYFTLQKWITDWFLARGLTAKGYMPGEDPNEQIDPDTIDFGEDEDLNVERNKTNIDFSGMHREIDNTQDQKFDEV